MFDSALERAAELDTYIAEHRKPIGPLHGLPISVKEHVYLKGTPATSGFVAWADDVSLVDALIVKCLRESGAVFHVKTTNPQTLMMIETNSPLYGETTNPHNTSLTPGGSSGGEGALIAMRGSILGIGTDIGGSIRVPAAFSGIYGLKPSVNRIPHSGLAGGQAGMENIIGCVGPMSADPEGLNIFCEVALRSNPWLEEPGLVEIPWKGKVEIPETLKIGVIWHDGVVSPHPPIRRALEEAAECLMRAGHEVVPWECGDMHRQLEAWIHEAYFLDAGEDFRETLQLGGEPELDLISWVMSKGPEKAVSARESWKTNVRGNALRTLYAQLWNQSGVDVILSPCNPAVASVLGESKYWGYSNVWNAMDFSSLVFPYGKVQPTDTWEKYPASNNLDKQGKEKEVLRDVTNSQTAFADTAPTEDGYMSEADKLFRSFYTGPERYKDAPISLQLIGRKHRDEYLLSVLDKVRMAIVQETTKQEMMDE
jgi:amidase